MSYSFIKNFIKNRKLLSLVTAVLLIFILLLVSEKTVLLDTFEKWLYDSLFYLKQPNHKEMVEGVKNPGIPEDFVFVTIDDKSLAENGKWPWSRDIHTEYVTNLESLSIKSLFLDVTFANPSVTPSFLSESLKDNPDLKKKVDEVYLEMDNLFAESLGKLDRVFLSSELLYNTEGLSRADVEFMESRFSFINNPGIVMNDSFSGVLPLYSSFAENSVPVAVKQFIQSDGLIRSNSLLFPYKREGGELKLAMSASLSLLLDYFYSDPDQIEIRNKSLVIRDAYIPETDFKTGKFINNKLELSKISELGTIRSRHFNSSFYHFLINEYSYFYPDSGISVLPYPVRIGVDKDGWTLLSGEEILKASRILQLEQVKCVFYRKRDFEIPYQMIDGKPFSYLINYAGEEETTYKDPYSGNFKKYSPVKMVSYSDISSLKSIEIPDLVSQDIQLLDIASYRDWFAALSEKEGRSFISSFDFENFDDFQNQILKDADSEQIAFLIYDYLQRTNDSEDPEINTIFQNLGFEEQIRLVNHFIQSGGYSDEVILDKDKIFALLQDHYSSYIRDFYDSFVFTGYYSKGIAYDLKQTPYGEMFGTNLIINELATLVTEKQIREIPFWINTICLIFVSLFLFLLFRHFSSLVDSIILLGAWIISYGFAYLLFARFNLVFNLALYFVTFLLLFIDLILIKLLFEERDKNFFKATFSRYLSPELINEMYETGDIPELGGENRKITAFFSDIEGFTSISEQLTPESLVEFLNRYLSSMTQIITENRGTLDKYIGDAIVAFFGAPHQIAENPLLAVKSALEAQRKLEELRREWSSSDLPWASVVKNMRMRIGLNSGDVITGNMGSSLRMDYTMIGDNVNLASRLESAAKQYSLYILMSQYTYLDDFIDAHGNSRKVQDFVKARFIDRIIVKGKTEPVDIYEPLLFVDENNEKKEELIYCFNQGTDKYFKREWKPALKDFQNSEKLEEEPEKGNNPSRIYIERCEHYLENPPENDTEWNGEFVLKNK